MESVLLVTHLSPTRKPVNEMLSASPRLEEKTRDYSLKYIYICFLASILPVILSKRALLRWSFSGMLIGEQPYTREITFIHVTCHASTALGSSMSSLLSLDLVKEFASHSLLTLYGASLVTGYPLRHLIQASIFSAWLERSESFSTPSACEDGDLGECYKP